jgi:hypothetical protein
MASLTSFLDVQMKRRDLGKELLGLLTDHGSRHDLPRMTPEAAGTSSRTLSGIR